MHRGWQGHHVDLWNLLACEMNSRATCVSVSWVKGHAKQVDVQRGYTTQEDKDGNDGADSLAVAGANKHAVPSEVVEAARERKGWAKSVHSMMVSVLKARFAAEDVQHHEETDAADRGSDDDACNELLDDEIGGESVQSDA